MSDAPAHSCNSLVKLTWGIGRQEDELNTKTFQYELQGETRVFRQLYRCSSQSKQLHFVSVGQSEDAETYGQDSDPNLL